MGLVLTSWPKNQDKLSAALFPLVLKAADVRGDVMGLILHPWLELVP